VVLTGVAALVAGAFSMGTGEYISVTNQNELVHSEVSLERQMLHQFPPAEQEELAGYFRQYGADPETAARMAATRRYLRAGVTLGSTTPSQRDS
jgi:vacuolar iron transporter family protein